MPRERGVDVRLIAYKPCPSAWANLGEILASQTLHPSIEKPMLDGQAEPPPAIQAALRRTRAGDARLGRCSKYGCDQTGCGGLSVVEQPASLIGALNSPRDKSADKRQSLKTEPISRLR